MNAGPSAARHIPLLKLIHGLLQDRSERTWPNCYPFHTCPYFFLYWVLKKCFSDKHSSCNWTTRVGTL